MSGKTYVIPESNKYMPTFLTLKEVWEYIGASNGYDAIQPTNKNSWLNGGRNHNFGDLGKTAVSFSMFLEIVFCALGGNAQSYNKEDTNLVDNLDSSNFGKMMRDIIDICASGLFTNEFDDERRHTYSINYLDEVYKNVIENSIDRTQTHRNSYIKLLNKRELRFCISVVNLVNLYYSNLESSSLTYFGMSSRTTKKRYFNNVQYEYDYKIPVFSLVDDMYDKIGLSTNDYSKIAVVNDIKISFDYYSMIPVLQKIDSYFLLTNNSRFLNASQTTNKILFDTFPVHCINENNTDDYGGRHLWFLLNENNRERKLKFVEELRNQFKSNDLNQMSMRLSRSNQADYIRRLGGKVSQDDTSVLRFYSFLTKNLPETIITFDTAVNRKLFNTYKPEEIVDKDIQIYGTIRKLFGFMQQLESEFDLYGNTSEEKYINVMNRIIQNDLCELEFSHGNVSDSFSFTVQIREWRPYGRYINHRSFSDNEEELFHKK